MKINIEKYDELMNNLRDENIPPQEAEILACKFFKAMYDICALVRRARGDAMVSEVSMNLLYDEAMKKSKSNTVTEKKGEAQSDPEYIEAMMRYQDAKDDVEYLKGLYDVFNNGHVFYRNIGKGGI